MAGSRGSQLRSTAGAHVKGVRCCVTHLATGQRSSSCRGRRRWWEPGQLVQGLWWRAAANESRQARAQVRSREGHAGIRKGNSRTGSVICCDGSHVPSGGAWRWCQQCTLAWPPWHPPAPFSSCTSLCIPRPCLRLHPAPASNCTQCCMPGCTVALWQRMASAMGYLQSSTPTGRRPGVAVACGRPRARVSAHRSAAQ